MLARYFALVIVLSFVLCAVAQTNDTFVVQKVFDFLDYVKTAYAPSIQNVFENSPSVQNLSRYIPSIVMKDEDPISHTTNLLKSLARDRLVDGHVTNYREIITSQHVTGLPKLIQGVTDYFQLWIHDVSNTTTTFLRVNKKIGLFEVPLYGQVETIAEICMQQGALYFYIAYGIKYTWRLFVYLLSFTQYNMNHLV